MGSNCKESIAQNWNTYSSTLCVKPGWKFAAAQSDFGLKFHCCCIFMENLMAQYKIILIWFLLL